MELFIPSFVALLFGVAIVYFVLPGMAPPILIGGSIIMLGVALYSHYSKFGRMEYEQATWQYNLRNYSSWIMMGSIILGAYGFYAMNKTEPAQSIMPTAITSAVSSPAMPSMMAPAVGGGLGSVMKTATTRINELMRRGRITTD